MHFSTGPDSDTVGPKDDLNWGPDYAITLCYFLLQNNYLTIIFGDIFALSSARKIGGLVAKRRANEQTVHLVVQSAQLFRIQCDRVRTSNPLRLSTTSNFMDKNLIAVFSMPNNTHTYITSHLSPMVVDRDNGPPVATNLTHLFRFINSHQSFYACLSKGIIFPVFSRRERGERECQTLTD
uniref:SFRICE_026216 n=1 Tax=Spodoptera frugiperda TaxID=7108 RepID=A0A2H1WAX0_SPOFR